MNKFRYLSLDELRIRLRLESQYETRAELLEEWFIRTQHIREQTAREAARAQA